MSKKCGKSTVRSAKNGGNPRFKMSDGRPSVSDIMGMAPVKARAKRFVKQLDKKKIVLNERERGLAAMAYQAGIAHSLKAAERALGDFGAAALFGTISQPVESDGLTEGLDKDETDPSTAPADKERVSQDAKKKGRFDPMYC